MPGLDDSLTRVLLGVLCLPHPSVRSCARYSGLSTSCTYRRLIKLRDLGLVEWEDGKYGTLRPLVRRVARLG